MAKSVYKVLSVRQPWAWALVAGVKRVENRSWDTPHRGLLLIHASKSAEDLGRFEDGDMLEDGTPLPPLADLRAAMGCVVGAVDLEDIVSQSTAKRRRLSFATGARCWLVGNARRFARPVPCLGQLNVWPLPEALRAEVEAALAGGTRPPPEPGELPLE